MLCEYAIIWYSCNAVTHVDMVYNDADDGGGGDDDVEICLQTTRST